MRVALLSTLEPSADDATTPRGLLRLGGRSVVHHQLAAAIQLGCEKVICLADGLPGELIAVQQAAESSGVTFLTAADGRAVALMVGPGDDLLVFADGLVTSAEAVSTLLGTRTGVIVQPVESGVAAGFERIDLNHAGGGVLRLPGRLVDGLAELPEDWNPVSALLRIAVQAQQRQVVLPQALADGGCWTLIRSDAEAHKFEPQWLRQHTEQLETDGPGRWLAARLVERLGPALLHAGTRPGIIALGAVTLGLIALVLAWFDLFAPAFVLLGLAWLMRRSAAILARVHGEPRRLAWVDPEILFRLLGDAIATAIMALNFAAVTHERDGLMVGVFVALVLIGLLRLVETLFAERRWAAWASDRLVLTLALAAASLSGVFDLVLRVAVLGVLGVALAASRPRTAASAEAAGADGQGERLTRP